MIIFAFGLADDPQPLIQLLFQRLVCHLKEGNGFGDTEKLLLWFQKEIKQDTRLDFMHNQYFNYTTVDDPTLFLRSTFYMFDNQTPDSRAIVKLNEGYSPQSLTPAECSINVQCPSVFLNVLKILQDIQNDHKILVSAFCLMWPESHLEPNQILSKPEKDDTAVLMKSALKLHGDLKIFDITGCHVTQPSFKHLAKQLCHCEEISTLYLRNVQQYIPILLGKAIATSPSLRTVSLEYSLMTSATAEAVLFGLSQCRSLQTLHLSECKLTNCLVHFFDNPNHTGFPSLKTLDLRRAQLSKPDLLAISGAMIQNKLPQLAKLFMAGNEQLGGCLQCFYPLKVLNLRYPVFQLLENLDLTGTNLSQMDIDHLGQMLRLKKLPSLKTLELGQNTLTGCIANLLGHTNPYPGLFNLEKMGLGSTAVNEFDLRSLSKVLNNPKMQKCKTLDISGNVLKGMIEILVEEFELPSLEVLNLQSCDVEAVDWKNLAEAIAKGKMPRVKLLELRNVNFHGNEDAVENFVRACVDYFKHLRMSILLSLDEVTSPDEFRDTINSLCKGSLVSIKFLKTTSKTANSASFEYSMQVSGPLKPGTNIIEINF